MAANDKNKYRITRAQLWKLWSFLGTKGWQTILESGKPNNRFVPVGANILKGLCLHPDHQDTSPSAFIYVEKGYYKCHGGSCEYYESNPIRLIAYIRECSYADALRYVCETFKPPFINPRAQSALDAEFKNQRIKQEIVGATHDLLCAVLNDPSNTKYASVKPALDWLINVRKLPTSVLHTLPIGLMPELGRLGARLLHRQKKQVVECQRLHLCQKIEPTSPANIVDDALTYMAAALQDTDFNGSVVFPLHVSPTEIGRIKLRVPQQEKKFIMPDDDFEDLLGLYGLGWAMNRNFFGSHIDENCAILVEGEMDALALLAHYAVTGSVTFPVLSVGGKGGSKYIEPILQSVGISQAYLVGDAPQKQGNDIAQNWLESISKTPIKIFTGWDRLGMSGDVDEAVQDHGAIKVLEVLWEKRDETFVQPWNWAFDRAAADLFDIPETDFRTQMETAAFHGRYILHTLEREKYVTEMAQTYNLNPLILKREISAGDHTEDGFIHSCMDSLREQFAVVGIQKTDKGRVLVLHGRRDQSFQTVRLADTKDMESLVAGIGGSLLSYVREFVGVPPFLAFPDPQFPDRKVVKTLVPELRTYMTTAVQDLAQGASELSQIDRHSQGYHHLTIDGVSEEFVVCGKKVFRIDRSSGLPAFEQLDGPIYKGVLFDTGIENPEKGREWYPGGLTVEKLQDAQGANLHELYDNLVQLYTDAFRFKHHEITAELCAALLMALPTMSALTRPVLTFITGDSSSGKTSLMSILSNVGAPGVRLLYASVGHQSYTAASIGRLADGMSNTLCLDEFESGDDERGMHINKIFEMLRGLITGEADRVISQGASGTKREVYCLPVFFAAIRGAARPQDLNRVLQIETEKVAFKVNPLQVIKEMFPQEKFDQMIQDLNLGMYEHALELVELEADIISQFSSLQVELGLQLEWRFASNLFAPLAIMRLLGKDWKGFLKAYVQANQFEISRIASVSETESRWNEILRSANIMIEPREPLTSIATLLITPEQRGLINSSSKGVFYDEETKYLLVLVDQATSLIPQHLRARLTGPHLKNILDRHAAAIPPKTILRCGILKRVTPFLGAGIRIQDVVVVDASRWLEGKAPEIKPKEETNGKADTTNSTGTTEPVGSPQAEKPDKETTDEKDDEASGYDWE